MLEHLPVTCWSLLVEKLSVKDLLAVSSANKTVWSTFKTTQGLWLQACSLHLGWPAAGGQLRHLPLEPPARQCQQFNCLIQPSTEAGLAQTGAANIASSAALAASDDVLACQAVAAMAGLAHTVQGLRPRFKAQSYLLPPWLAMQPGKARGFVRVLEPSSTALNPSLVLDAAEVQWLSLGCLSGHAGGVFVSSCNSSPRSHQRCGCMAAVVINKQVVAELYLPPGCSAPDRWGSLLGVPDTHTGADSGADVSKSGGVIAGRSTAAASAGVGIELWLHSSVELTAPGPDVAAAGSCDGSRGGNRSAGRRRRGNREAATTAAAAGVTWRHIHTLIMSCIADNASRFRAVRCTAFIPPGTAAAADLDCRVRQLLDAAAPVLDLRQYSLEAVQVVPNQQQEQQHKKNYHEQRHGPHGSLDMCNEHCNVMSAVEATTAALSLGPTGMMNGTSSARAPAATSGSQLTAARHSWRQVCVAVQTALSAAAARKAAEVAAADAAAGGSTDVSGGSNSLRGLKLSEDDQAEVLAALIQQLPDLAPQLQLLVLPVVLPGGRAGVKQPGGSSSTGCTRLSAPRLLSLNVPFLIPLRQLWDKLPNLRQVLLMVGTSSSSSSTCAANLLSQDVPLHAGCGSGVSGVTPAGSNGLKQQQQKQQLVRGVFSLQQLEQQWQQEAHLATALHDGHLQPDLQATQQAIHRADVLHMKGVTWEGRGRLLQQSSTAAVVLPGYAVEAVQGMVLSCMDRCSPAS